MLTIAICSSANFYRQAVDVQSNLEKLGFKVILPEVAERMKKTGDFDVTKYKTWFGDKNDYIKKTEFIRGHLTEIEKCDAALVLNYEKNGVANYIGGNVLMEMAVAFYLKKTIYILNEVPEESSFVEEIYGLNPIVLHGKIDKLSKV
jgi:hypothetical protein